MATQPLGDGLRADIQDMQDEIDLGRIVTILWNRKGLILFAGLLALALGAFVYLSTPSVYRADALLQLEERGMRLALPQEIAGLADDDPRTVTEIELLRSRMILGQVVANLNLDWRVTPERAPLIGNALAQYDLPLPAVLANHDVFRPFQRYDETLVLDFLEVPPDWLGEPLILTSGGRDAPFEVTLPDGTQISGRPGDMLRAPERGLALQVAEIEAPAGRIFSLRQVSELAAINAMRPNLSVSERGRSSGILSLTYTAPSRTEAQRILDAIARVYVRQNIDRSAAEADSSLEFIESQLPAARDRLRTAEAALDAYRQTQDTIDVDFQTSSLLTQLATVENELGVLEDRETEIADRYTRNHPIYQQLLEARTRLLEREEELRGQVDSLPETQREIVTLTRDVELAQEIFTQLQVRLQEVQVLRASTVGNVRIVDVAEAAPSRISPNRNRILALSLVIGLMLGIGAALLLAWSRRGVRSAQEIEALGLPLFATVNETPAGRVNLRRRERVDILAEKEPGDLSVEAIRSLRTSLHFGMLDAKTSSVAVTSAAPGAGKSFTCVNLAVVSAQGGLRVCLVDCDMRRGQLRKYFGLSRQGAGLSDVLSDVSPLADALHETHIENLHVIPAGAYPPNPSELLMRDRLGTLIRELDAQFDLILLDCAPTLAVTDPVIVAREAGAVLMVVRFGTTPIDEVRAVKSTFDTVDIPITGVVLNGFDPKVAKADGGAYAYSYKYSYTTRKN